MTHYQNSKCISCCVKGDFLTMLLVIIQTYVHQAAEDFISHLHEQTLHSLITFPPWMTIMTNISKVEGKSGHMNLTYVRVSYGGSLCIKIVYKNLYYKPV